MSKRILAASPQTAFGDLLRLSLEKGSDFSVNLARTGSDVLTAISRENYDLAILDGELKDQPFLSLIQNMHLQQPQIRIIVIPQAAGNTRESLNAVTVDGFIDKPINLNDLVGLVKDLSSDFNDLSQKMVLPQAPRVLVKNPAETKWIEDHDPFQQNLYQLASRSVAEAVFVMRDQLVWAQASREDAIFNHQVIDLFLRAWDGKSRLDLVKVFRQTRDKPTWLLYATSLIENYSLIMIFDARIPMREVRGHVIRMANGLSDVHLFESSKDEETGFFKSLKELEIAQSAENEKSKPEPANYSGEGLSKPNVSDGKLHIDEPAITYIFIPKDRANQLVGSLKEAIKQGFAKWDNDSGWKLNKLVIRPDHLECSFDIQGRSQSKDIPAALQNLLESLVFTIPSNNGSNGKFWDENPLILAARKVVSRGQIQDYIQKVRGGNPEEKE